MREERGRSGARGPLGQCSLCSSKPRDSSTVAGKIQRFLLSENIHSNKYDLGDNSRNTTVTNHHACNYNLTQNNLHC